MRPRRVWILVLMALLAGCKGRARRSAPARSPRPVATRAVDGGSAAGAATRTRPAVPDATPPAAKTPRKPAFEAPPLESTEVFAFPGAGPEFLDPSKLSESAGVEVVRQIFEPLLTYPRGRGEPRPGVAKSWEVREDGLVYTFHLREDARWSDGKPVVAEDFRWAWIRKLDPATGSKSAEHLWFIKGAKTFNQGKSKDPSSVGVAARDPHTLVVTLEHPLHYFKWYAASAHYAPLPRHVVERFGDRWTRPEHVVSNGAYLLREWKLRDRMVLEKNLSYWDAGNVRIPTVVVYETDSMTAAVDWYETGKIQWVPGMVPLDKVRAFRRSGRPDFHIAPYLCVYYYLFRVDRRPFDDARVRRAFNMAIDKERLVRHVLQGGQEPARHLVPNLFGDQGYTSPEGDDYDPEGARRLLSEAGFPRGVGLPEIELVYNTYDTHRMVAEFVQRNLKENLGVELSLHNMEWKSLLKKLQTGDFQLSRLGWCALSDPYPFVKVLRGDSPNNHTGYKNPRLDGLLDRALSEPKARRRVELIREAERVIGTDMPVLPLFFYTQPYLLHPRVCGFEENPEDVHYIKDLGYDESCRRIRIPNRGHKTP